MLYSIDCNARVNAQDPTYPTYKKVDCTLHCNANDDNFYGKLIDCTFAVTTLIITACTNWSQGIRLLVTVDGVDISSVLTGAVHIKHDKNMVSTFSLNLGSADYVPITNSHIDLDKVVVITVYINGQEKKLFTGLVNNIEVENTPFNVKIDGYDYGKKLLEKRDTIVSVQDLAISAKRSDVIKYLAEQAGITDVEVPETGLVTIDNSFSDQSIWDMIQKEAMVDLYWVRFNEDGMMQLKLDDIKTNTTIYPTADWTYGENRFKRLSYRKSKEDIINKIIVLGKTTQKRIPHTTTYLTNPDYSEGGGGEVIFTPTITTLFSDSLSFDEAEIINEKSSLNYTKKVGDIILKIVSYNYSPAGGNIHICIGCNSQSDWESYIITSKTAAVGGSATLKNDDPSNHYSMGGDIRLHGTMFIITRQGGGKDGLAFTFNVTVYGYKNKPPSEIENIEDVYQPIYETNTTYETRYDQISVSVTDPNSIAKYGEHDRGSIEYPLLETEAQCEAVGRKIIQDSHRNIVNTSFKIPFNPLVAAGQTIQFSDSKIGFTIERYYVERLSHSVYPGEDSSTDVECVYYV